MQPWQIRAEEFHPYMVDSIDALPESLRAMTRAALPPQTTITRALVVPTEYRSEETTEPHWVPEQALVFVSNGALHVQAGLNDEPAPTPIFVVPEMLLYMQSSHLLLHGELELLSAVQNQAAKLVMEFNAIGWRLMDTEWRELVGRAIGVPVLPADQEKTESEQEQALLASLPAKFAEGLRKYGLYTGETLFGTVFQPATWTQTLVVFDQQIMPNTLLALTDVCVLILKEEPALVRKSEQFGLIVTRIPRRAIADVQTVQAAAQANMQMLRIALVFDGVAGEQNVLLEPETAQLWLDLWQQNPAPQ